MFVVYFFAGSLEGFMLMRLLNARDMIGCGGEPLAI